MSLKTFYFEQAAILCYQIQDADQGWVKNHPEEYQQMIAEYKMLLAKHEQEIEIEKAKETLRKAGYFVDNLWHVNDVTDKFKCDNYVAMEILDNTLTHDFIMATINDQIYEFGNQMGLEGA